MDNLVHKEFLINLSLLNCVVIVVVEKSY